MSTAIRTEVEDEPFEIGRSFRRRSITGWRTLVRLTLRRDRIRAPLWIIGIAALVLVSAASIEGLYATAAELAGYAAIVEDNALMIIQAGPGYGLDEPTQATVLMNEVSIWTHLVVAMMSVFTVIRHTRAEEESNRAELVRSAPVGRHAASVATLAAVLVVNLAASSAVCLGLVLRGYEPAGSVAFAAAMTGAGLLYAALALVAVQLAATSAAATGLTLVVLMLSYLLRAIGDVGNGRLTWLSPLGWAQAVRPFADERWWALGLLVATTGVAIVAAVILAARRDFGAGIVGQHPGPASGPTWLGSPLALALVLHRASIIGWSIGAAVVGGFYGAAAEQAEQIVADNPELADFLTMGSGGSITDAFLAMASLMCGLLASGYAVGAVLRMRREETAGRVEAILATPRSRVSWASSHAIAAALGLVVMLLAAGSAMGVGAALTLGNAGRVPQLIGATVAMAPAAAVLGAMAFVLCAALPRMSALAWLGVVVAVVVGLLGELLDLPPWVRELSPFTRVPALPLEAFAWQPYAALASVIVALVSIGLIGSRRRDFAAA